MIVEGFYRLLALIDSLVYSLVSTMVSVNIDIASKEIFKVEQIEAIANRIYIVVGVLMLFKLVISAIQYMINPDTFDDKEKGLTGILKKTAISIGLIVLVPAVFNFMVAIQNTIITSIPKIIFGNEQQTDYQKTTDDMAFTVLSSFITPNEGKGGSVGENGEIHDIDSFREKAAEGCGGGVVGDVKNCKYNYMIIISTLAGGFLCYVLLSLTLDVAIRTIKFAIIRILAPIPISSYVLSKDRLNKFVKTSLTVYFDLFIRLAIIYFIIFAIQEIVKADILKNIAGNDDWFRNAIVNIAIIGGLFLFAKNAPKFISELLGLPDIGSGDMKDMFKPVWQRAGVLGAGAGMVTAGLGNAINKAKFTTWKGTSVGQKLKDAAKVAGTGISGAASAGFHGGIAAMQGKNTKEVNAAGYKRAIKARQNRDLDKLNGVTGFDRMQTRAINELGIDTKANLAENKQKAYSTLHSDVGTFKKAVMGRIDKNPSVAMRSNGGAMTQLGQILYNSKDIINSGTNKDLKNVLTKFDEVDVKDSSGAVIGRTYKLRAGERLGYYDLEAIRVNAEQSNIGSISGKMEPLKTIAQKELFSDAMSGTVVDISGNLMDEFNYGDKGYIAAGYTKGADGIWRNAAGKKRSQAHSDVTTAVQSAMQHITENGVPLGMDATLLQKWFQGTVDPSNPEDAKLLAALPPELRNKIVGKDFGALDDEFQRRSEKLSSEMASSKEHLARASLERRNANKDKK